MFVANTDYTQQWLTQTDSGDSEWLVYLKHLIPTYLNNSQQTSLLLHNYRKI